MKKCISLVLLLAVVISSITSKAYYEKDNLWNVDFESHNVNSANSPDIQITDASGNAIFSERGDEFRCHTGSTESKIYIADISGNKTLCLETANIQDTVQTNNFYSTVSQGVAVFEMDVMVEDFNTNKKIFWLVYEDSSGATLWSEAMSINKSGVFEAKNSLCYSPVQKGFFHHVKAVVNIDKNTLDYYIGNNHFAHYDLEDISKTVKMSIRATNGAKSKLFIDNIKVYEATDSPYANMHIYINDEKKPRLSEGLLSVGADFTGVSGEAQCIIAVYKGAELCDVRLIPVSSANSAYKNQIDILQICQVDETMAVKLFIVEPETVRPYTKHIIANKLGVSNKMLNVEQASSIFKSDYTQQQILNGKIGYHPDSGILVKDNTKEFTGLFGEYDGTDVYVPINLIEKISNVSVNVKSDLSYAIVDGVFLKKGDNTIQVNNKTQTLSKAPYEENGMLMIPLKDVCEHILGKNIYITDGGINDGAVIIADTAFEISTSQDLNDYLLYHRPDKEKILCDYENSEYYKQHPRVIMTQSDFDKLKNEDDSYIVKQKRKLLSNAYSYLNQKNLVYELRDGVRLWYVSMDFMDRIMTLALAYKLTDNKQYFDKCIEEMNSISEFSTWHPEHHIDVGGLAVGFAIGYDWLYNDLTEKQRAKYEAAIYDLCFTQYFDGFTGKSSDMKSGIIAKNNHNSVMNSGITMCAVAFMDEYPEICSYMLSNSLRATEVTIKNFYPDGSWYEGLGYGCMTLEYLSLQLATMQKVFNTCYGIDCAEGMDEAAMYVMNMQCQTGAFPFYDGGSGSNQWHSGVFWFAEHFNTTEVSAYKTQHLNASETARSIVASLMYYHPDKISENINFPGLNKLYKENNVIIMRDSWESNTPTFFAAKGGRAADPHGHLDMGTYTFYSDGVRWLTDYGAEDYNLPDFWSGSTREGKRWNYFALRAEAHNCLIINPDNYAEYDPDKMAKFTKYGENGCILDMTPLHYGKAKKAERGYLFGDGRKTLTVRDEITLSSESDIYSFLQTEHNVVINGNTAIITNKNNSQQTLRVEFVSNKPFTLTSERPKPLSDVLNIDGLKDLSANTRINLHMRASGNVNITVKLTPCSVTSENIVDTPISEWEVE